MAASKLLSRLFGNKPRTVLRVNGLVKAMSLAREQLTNGIPSLNADEFRLFVNRTLWHTDQICTRNRITPRDLPTPSYHAYQFLKGIDLDNLPINDEIQENIPSLRISNLGAAVRHIQQRMMIAARDTYQEALGARKEMRNVQSLIHQQNAYIQCMLKKKKATIEALTPRSMQIAHWLFYLNDNDHFVNTIQQLIHFCRIYETIRLKAKSGKKAPPLNQVFFEFTPMAALYRWRIKDGLGTLSMHPGFLTANEAVIQAILGSAIVRRTPHQSLLIRQMASSSPFLSIAKQLDGQANPESAVGQYHNLNTLFQEINQQYFKNRCPQPKLKWGTRFTRRKYGMYLPSTDTIVLSLSLDQPAVPHYVVAFILYHEILHKVLGMKDTAKRQIAHTTEFRRQERLFERYEEAQQFLESLACSG